MKLSNYIFLIGFFLPLVFASCEKNGEQNLSSTPQSEDSAVISGGGTRSEDLTVLSRESPPRNSKEENVADKTGKTEASEEELLIINNG